MYMDFLSEFQNGVELTFEEKDKVFQPHLSCTIKWVKISIEEEDVNKALGIHATNFDADPSPTNIAAL